MYLNHYPFGFPLSFDLQRPWITGWGGNSYTMRMQELVQSQYPTADLLDDATMLACVKDVVFSQINLNVINEKYRDAFVLGFAQEFWMEEIGQETVDLWKLAIKSVINKSYGRINYIYELSEKELFKEHSHRVYNSDVDSTGTRVADRKFGEVRTNTGKVTNNGTTSDTQDRTVSNENSGNETTAGNRSGEDSRTTDGRDSRNLGTKQRFSDTPQNGLTMVENNQYLTNATLTDVTESGTDHSTVGGTNSEETSGSRQSSSNGSETLHASASGTSSNTMDSNSNDKLNHTENSDENSTGNTTTAGSEDYYEVDLETVLVGSPVLDAVWRLFDECFMGVY